MDIKYNWNIEEHLNITDGPQKENKEQETNKIKAGIVIMWRSDPCVIWGFHIVVDEGYILLGFDAVINYRHFGGACSLRIKGS